MLQLKKITKKPKKKKNLKTTKKNPKNISCSEASDLHCNHHCGPCPTCRRYGDLDWRLTLASLLYVMKEAAQSCHSGWLMGPGVKELELGAISSLLRFWIWSFRVSVPVVLSQWSCATVSISCSNYVW